MGSARVVVYMLAAVALVAVPVAIGVYVVSLRMAPLLAR
jgi:hypothetical protein